MGVRITKDLLSGYRKTKQDIVILEKELDEMKEGSNGFGNSTIFDYKKGYPRPQSVVGFDWKRYERREKILENKKHKVAAVEEWIENIEDVQTRTVFRMYYIKGESWKTIALKLKVQNEDYPRIVIRDRYLKKVGIL